MFQDRGKNVYTRTLPTRIQVKAPYDARFVLKAHELRGRWKPRSAVWSFPLYSYGALADILNRIYGTSLPFRSSDE